MKRLVAHYIDTSDFGGAEQAVLNLASALDPGVWQCVLLHPDHSGLTRLMQRARDAGLETVSVPDMRGRASVTRLPGFRRTVRSIRPDVFHAHLNWPLACSGGIIAASMAKVPAIVATVQLYSPLPSALTIPLQRALVTRAVDRYIAVSAHVAEMISAGLGVGTDRIRVIYNGVPLREVPRQRSFGRAAKQGRTIVTLARLDRQKGLDILIEAIARMDGVRLVIAGEGPERDSLEALVERLRAGERVELRGFVADTDSLLDGADLFVLPSRNEGLPLSIVEAMLAGVPVVATDIGGTDELVTQDATGILVPVDDVVSLEGAMRRVLSDTRLAARLGEEGRNHAQAHFTSERMAQLVSRSYEEVLGGASATGQGDAALKAATARSAGIDG